MKLYLVNHDQRYAAEQMLLTLFPAERPEYPEEMTDGDCAVLTLSRGAHNATVTCRLRRDGKTVLGRAAVPNTALTDSVEAPYTFLPDSLKLYIENSLTLTFSAFSGAPLYAD